MDVNRVTINIKTIKEFFYLLLPDDGLYLKVKVNLYNITNYLQIKIY